MWLDSDTFIQPKEINGKHPTMSVTLRRKENSDGSISQYLDVYGNGKRHKEYLKECKLTKASTPADKENNKSKVLLAKKIAVQRAHELQASDYNIIAEHKSKVELLAYFENYITRYTKKDKRNVQGVTNAFKEFMKLEGIKSLTLKGLTEATVTDFAEYLQDKSSGEGAASYFARFKKVLRQAVREKVLIASPADDVTIKRDESIKKNILTLDEIKKLAATETANEDLKRAFLFSCFTGLRWVDVTAMQWRHIDLKNKVLSLVQAKTGIKVTVQLHNSAVALLSEQGKPNEHVFTLPSHTGAAKTLRAWVKRAEIDKHITWHCARHSFATNLIALGADVTTVSKLIGHSGLKYTMRYTHIADDLKRAAVDSLPEIVINSKPTN